LAAFGVQAPAGREDGRRPYGKEHQPAPVEPAGGLVAATNPPQLGQLGAYFEVRTLRRWWALWTKKRVWQQVSSWQMGQPPAGAQVVTVADVAALAGSGAHHRDSRTDRRCPVLSRGRPQDLDPPPALLWRDNFVTELSLQSADRVAGLSYGWHE
jgi:hypothetical protein